MNISLLITLNFFSCLEACRVSQVRRWQYIWQCNERPVQSRSVMLQPAITFKPVGPNEQSVGLPTYHAYWRNTAGEPVTDCILSSGSPRLTPAPFAVPKQYPLYESIMAHALRVTTLFQTVRLGRQQARSSQKDAAGAMSCNELCTPGWQSLACTLERPSRREL